MKVKVVKNCEPTGENGVAYCMRRYCSTPGCKQFRAEQRYKENLAMTDYLRQMREGLMFREGNEAGVRDMVYRN